MHLFAHVCFIFIVSPPLYSSVDPTAVADYTAAEYDYYVDDDCTPTVELPVKQNHSLPQISPIFPYISCTRHCCYCYVTILFNCIAYFCRPLMYLPISYAAL